MHAAFALFPYDFDYSGVVLLRTEEKSNKVGRSKGLKRGAVALLYGQWFFQVRTEQKKEEDVFRFHFGVFLPVLWRVTRAIGALTALRVGRPPIPASLSLPLPLS